MPPTRAVPRSFAALLLCCVLAACGRRAAPLVPPPADGLLGVRYQALPEGLVVTEVTPRGGAEAAGIVPGALLLEVDGVSLVGRPAGARSALLGPPGSQAALVWTPPLGDAPRSAAVTRGRLGTLPVPRPSGTPESIRALRRAVDEGSPRELEAAVDALVADGFGGRSPGRAVRSAVRAARSRGPAHARRLAGLLAPHVGEDPLALRLLVDLAVQAGDDDTVLALAPRLMAVRTPDLVLPDGTPVDLGGDAEARTAWIGALWLAGRHAEAIAAARALLRTRDVPEARALVGMAPPDAAPPALEVVRPPAPPAALALRDGRAFDLAQERGEVVLFAFWATWCRPCLEELPALDRMAAARPGLRVVAVSVDQGPDAATRVDAMVAQLGLALPVAHEPALGRAYGVEALPSVRLVGRGGGVVHAARGHSAAGLARLEAAIDEALAAPASATAAVGTLWGEGALGLQAWAPLAGVGQVAAGPAGAAVSVAGAAPVRFDGDAVELDVSGGGGGGPITWSRGPVSGPERGHWLRARDPDGAVRWLRTLPSGLVALAASGPNLFVGLEEELILLDGQGAVLARHAGRVSGLAPDGEGGAWVAAPDARLHVRWSPEQGLTASEHPVPDIRRVGPGGSIGAGRVRQIVSGPFGPDGAERFVVSTADGRVIGLDGQGAPALVARLPDEVSLSVVQAGESGAALALALPGLGVGLATLALP